ncbi:Rmf/CrpP fold protein [Streptomyces sp. NPDC059008]|uniref:Rmf/CrpP fold protein n=1 Tax=Streptomyces sp. NPDC059008 TaxID=3346693 RepID=UPI003697DBC3
MAQQTRESLTRALNEGAEAGRAGHPPTACPYPVDTAAWAAWVRGYAKQAPLPDEVDA